MVPVLVRYYKCNLRSYEFVGLFDLETKELLCPEIQSENIIMVWDVEGYRCSNRYDWSCYIIQGPDQVWEER